MAELPDGVLNLDGEGPDRVVLPLSPSDSSEDEMQLVSEGHRGNNSPEEMCPEKKPDLGLLQAGPSRMSPARAGPSVERRATMSAELMRPAAGSSSGSPEGQRLSALAPGRHCPERAHQTGLQHPSIPECPILLIDDDEVVLYKQLMTELGGMSTYQQDVALVRVRQALLDIKHNSGFPGATNKEAP